MTPVVKDVPKWTAPTTKNDRRRKKSSSNDDTKHGGTENDETNVKKGTNKR